MFYSHEGELRDRVLLFNLFINQPKIWRCDCLFLVTTSLHNTSNLEALSYLFGRQLIKHLCDSRLVATLGSKSSTKKVTRKAIMGVNLKKACETIIEPDAPMALRLQSNLLYGVSRVYTQKWDYLLSDTQAIHTSIRTFLSATKSSQIDKNAGKARPDQLIIVDDPAFLVDNPLEPPPLDFDSIIHEQNYQRSSQSFLSIYPPRKGSIVSEKSGPFLGLDLPSSSHGDSLNSYQITNNDSFERFSAVRGTDQAAVNVHDDENLLFHNDDLFEIDDFGEIRELSVEKKGQKRSLNIPQITDLDFGSANNKPANEEYQDSITIHEELSVNINENDQTTWLNNEEERNENVEPFPIGIVDRIQSRQNDPKSHKESSPISAQATLKRKRVKTKKNIIIDESIELENFDMRRMAAEYHKIMIDQVGLKTRAKEISESKKNALYYVFGTGINNIGESLGLSNTINSLVTFAGEALHERIMGHFTTPPLEHRRKRSQSESEIDEKSTNKRARNMYLESSRRPFISNDEFISPHEDEYGYDKSMEVGREAASALRDHPSSGMMPWNISASAHSRPGSSMQRLGSRLTPASPLFGRGGSTHPIDLEGLLENQNDVDIYDLNAKKDQHAYRFLSDDGDDRVADINFPSQPWQSLHGDMKTNEFGIFGPAAGVDSQTAATSQWVREALDRESINFFDFLRSTLVSEINCGLIDNTEEIGVSKNQKCITFSKLIEPEKNNFIVAAQAFYHVLNLGNKHVIVVKQENQVDSKIDSDIFISII
ncbi:putative rad21 rec8 n terminal domain-containing protein [Erysiphe neolycopersici]|uniref:Putative rad21 rec8 n terminal domain-containing protein n=1 Tax=Erysiphe neolycopersici TaxID=212602 RepID=A0A420HP99_9PEZI|nr:putative rad21 rec8 n terminal domain-containing protein [Erysiphe neolycopersici]